MTKPRPTVTLYFSTLEMPAIITRLTTYLLQHHYTFMQICYDTQHVGFEIFTQQGQLVVRLTLQAADDPGALSRRSPDELPAFLSADAVRLLQHLLRTV